MSFLNIFDGKFVEFCKKHQDFNFNNPEDPQPSTQDISISASNSQFMVITGKNGIGKSRLLQLIREYIVTVKNENYPYMIVRRLDYGEHDDEYDPDKTDHPLVTENVLKTFNCNFNKWEETNTILQIPSLEEKLKQIFEFIFGEVRDFDIIWKYLSKLDKVKEIKEQFFKYLSDNSTLMNNMSEQEKNNKKF